MDKSKENTRIADLMNMVENTTENLFIKISMGIKNPAIYSQFMNEGLGPDLFSYAVAANLLDWNDVKWLKGQTNENSEPQEMPPSQDTSPQEGSPGDNEGEGGQK